MYETSPEALDRVWERYLKNFTREKSRYFEKYNYVSRKSATGQRFEDWLFSQGARVVQKDHKRFLRFYSEDDAIMFMLKWS